MPIEQFPLCGLQEGEKRLIFDVFSDRKIYKIYAAALIHANGSFGSSDAPATLADWRGALVLVRRHRDLGVHPEACYTGACTNQGMCGCAGHARYAPKQTSCLAFIRTSVSHNSLKSSPISLILLYLSSSRQCQDAHTICEEIFWLFYMAISCRTKQLSIHNLFISMCNYIK